MVDFDTNVRITEIQRSMDEVKERVNRLLEVFKPEEDLWDNSDIIRHWKVSERTLAEWRADKKISYSKVGKKVFYTKEDRDRFLKNNHIKVNKNGC